MTLGLRALKEDLEKQDLHSMVTKTVDTTTSRATATVSSTLRQLEISEITHIFLFLGKARRRRRKKEKKDEKR